MNTEINTKSSKREKNTVAHKIDMMLTLSRSTFRGAGNFTMANIVDALYCEFGLTVSETLVRQIVKYQAARKGSPITIISRDWLKVMTTEQEAIAFPPSKNMVKTLARMERARLARNAR